MKLARTAKFPWITLVRYKPPTFWDEVRAKTWVRVHETGEIAVLDHLKPLRRYGVRPVDVQNARYFPSAWEHWPKEYREFWPREYDLAEEDFTVLTDEDLPAQVTTGDR